MGWLKKIVKKAKKVVGLAAPFAAKIGPWAPYVLAGYSIYQGVNSYYKGKKLRRQYNQWMGQEIEAANQAAQEQASYLQGQAEAAQRAASLQAHAASRQAHALNAAAAQARALGEKNAQHLLAEGEETVGRMLNEHRSLESMTKARLAASGVRSDKGTPKMFQSRLKKENRGERQWVEDTFKHNAEIAREGGEIEARQLRAAASGAGAGAAAIMAEGAAATAEANYLAQRGLDEARLYGEELRRNRPKKKGFGSILKGFGGAALTLYGGGAFKGFGGSGLPGTSTAGLGSKRGYFSI